MRVIELVLNGGDDASSDLLASDLDDYLQEQVVDLGVRRRRESERTQDFGAILTVALTSSAVASIVAAALSSWLGRHHGARLTVREDDQNGGFVEYEINHLTTQELERHLRNRMDDSP